MITLLTASINNPPAVTQVSPQNLILLQLVPVGNSWPRCWVLRRGHDWAEERASNHKPVPGGEVRNGLVLVELSITWLRFRDQRQQARRVTSELVSSILFSLATTPTWIPQKVINLCNVAFLNKCNSIYLFVSPPLHTEAGVFNCVLSWWSLSQVFYPRPYNRIWFSI